MPFLGRFILTACTLFAAAPAAFAQNGAIASVTFSGLVGDEETSPAISANVGYRVNRVLGFGVEVTHAPDFSDQPQYRILASLRPAFDDVDGSATLFTTNIRLEIPTTTQKVIPFAVAGAGIASVSEKFPVYALAAASARTQPSQLLIGPSPLIYPGPDYTNVTTSMALTLGGGVSVLVTEHFSVDADLRALKLLEQNGGRTIGRFGAGVSYRF